MRSSFCWCILAMYPATGTGLIRPVPEGGIQPQYAFIFFIDTCVCMSHHPQLLSYERRCDRECLQIIHRVTTPWPLNTACYRECLQIMHRVTTPRPLNTACYRECLQIIHRVTTPRPLNTACYRECLQIIHRVATPRLAF